MRRTLLSMLPLLSLLAFPACSSDRNQKPTSSGADGKNAEGGTDGTTEPSNGGDASANVGIWDYVGIVGTGQSLAVGTPPVASTTQPYQNLKLSLGGNLVPGSEADPWAVPAEGLALVPLVEPIRRLASGYPAPYPGNVYGETPHSAMANEITAQVISAMPGSNYITVHTVVGESGQGIVALKKQSGSTTETTGRAYAATLFEARAINGLARAQGKTYGIGAIVLTHGETDSGSTSYKTELLQLYADYNADLSAITGQKQNIPIYLSQQYAFPNGEASAGQRPAANQVQWQLGSEHPGEFVCTGPKYQYEVHPNGDGVHLSARGYQMLGEKTAQVYFERTVLGRDWRPLHPTAVERDGRVVTVRFHVPVPPLSWDEALDAPALPEWVNGRGFELRSGANRIAIESVAIADEAVAITAASDLPAAGVIVGYALSSQGVQMSTASKAVRWGQLRDSDPFVGSTTQAANPNYGVSFELPVP